MQNKEIGANQVVENNTTVSVSKIVPNKPSFVQHDIPVNNNSSGVNS
jgi:hypothetical protein